ncbi:MAG: hypothetical protein ACHQ06_05940 [Candidatus Dormibacteria bacterium]|jgi:hypothetical protein
MTETTGANPGAHREIFHHVPHPRIGQRQHEGPATTTAVQERLGFNGKVGVLITTVVGTMWAAYIFTILALISLPGAISSGNTVIIVGWIAQTFLQLVLLPIIIVGQNVQSAAADKRSQQTYSDAEAILAECLQLQAHLQAQDKVLDDLVTRLERVAPHGA